MIAAASGLVRVLVSFRVLHVTCISDIWDTILGFVSPFRHRAVSSRPLFNAASRFSGSSFSRSRRSAAVLFRDSFFFALCSSVRSFFPTEWAFIFSSCSYANKTPKRQSAGPRGFDSRDFASVGRFFSFPTSEKLTQEMTVCFESISKNYDMVIWSKVVTGDWKSRSSRGRRARRFQPMTTRYFSFPRRNSWNTLSYFFKTFCAAARGEN